MYIYIYMCVCDIDRYIQYIYIYSICVCVLISFLYNYNNNNPINDQMIMLNYLYVWVCMCVCVFSMNIFRYLWTPVLPHVLWSSQERQCDVAAETEPPPDPTCAVFPIRAEAAWFFVQHLWCRAIPPAFDCVESSRLQRLESGNCTAWKQL